MPALPWNNATRKARREDLAKAIRYELDAVLRFRHKDGHEFICLDDIEKIWTLQRIQNLSKGLSWDKPISHERALADYKLVLSVLAWIHWENWTEFGRTFLDHVDRRGQYDREDRSMPFSNTTVVHAQQSLNNEFLKRQYIFLPIELAEEGSNQHARNLDEYDTLYRLPFLEAKEIGTGATGDVFKALVAPKYFLFEHGHPNPTSMWVAIKRIPRSDQIKTRNFVSEQKALRTFKQCLQKHDNIMHSYMSFTHGPDFVIISPLANLDLAKFFSGQYGDFDQRQRHFTPFDLFQEAACLAGALNFLHNGLELRGSKIACAHLDFKPDNILVRWTDNSQSTSVGQWLIHDFGTSRIKQSAEDTSTGNALAPGDFLTRFSLTKAQRSPSTFQAPEVQNNGDRTTGRESDMWSFGCIVAVALAFALGGPMFADNILGANYHGMGPDSDMAQNDWFYTRIQGRSAVKMATRDWLDDRARERSDERWIPRIIDLIFKMLIVQPADRLKADDAQEQLNCISGEESQRMRSKCRWRKLPSPIAPDSRSSMRYRDPDPGLYPLEASEVAHDQNIPPTRRNPSIVRSDTHTLGQLYTPSTVPAMPRSTSRSHQSDDSSLDKGARRSSSGGQITFGNLASLEGSLKSVVCGMSTRTAFMSRSSVLVHNFRYHNTWTRKRPPRIPDISTSGFYAPKAIECIPGFEWDLISLCGDWLVLRANNGAECRIVRYHCSPRNLDNHTLDIWTETPFTTNKYDTPAPDAVNGIANDVLEVKVNIQGDVLLMFDEYLCLYSSLMGLHSLEIKGQLRRASFSSDGTYIFAWTKSSSHTYGHQNQWYIWHINSTAIPLVNTTRPWIAARRPGQGKDNLIFPFSNYFAAFEIPDRFYIVGKDPTNPVITLQSPVEGISAGVSYDYTYDPSFSDSGFQRLILVQQDSNPRILSLPLLAQVRSSTPSKLQDLQLGFDTKTHGIAITRDEKGTYIVVSHPKGVIERRAILL